MNRKRVLHGIGLVLLLAAVVPFVIYAVPGVIGADHSYVILSGSMEPEMSPGDAVIVEETDTDSAEAGDVITFTRDGSGTPVTHRVVDVHEQNGERMFETKGDANENADRERVAASNVIGTVSLTIPYIGYVVHFVNTPLGFAMTVLLPLGLLVLSEVWTFVRDSTRDPADGAPDSNPKDPSEPSAIAPNGVSAIASTGATAGTDASPPVGEDPDADIRTEEGQEPTAGAITIAPADVGATTVLLVLATPYTAYVALQLQTLPTIAIAYTVGFSAAGLLALQIAAVITSRRTADESQTASTEPPVHDAPDDERGRTESPSSHVFDGPTPPPAVSDTGTNENDPADGEDAHSVPGEREFEWADLHDATRTEDGES